MKIENIFKYYTVAGNNLLTLSKEVLLNLNKYLIHRNNFKVDMYSLTVWDSHTFKKAYDL